MSEGKKEILLGDCLELMKQLPDKSVDMILCDLPYGTTACKWDTIIPFDKLWEQYERIIKPNGAIVLTASQPFTSALVMSKPKLFKHEWIWEKSKAGNFQLAKIQPLKITESVLVFSNGVVNYYPIPVEHTEATKIIYKKHGNTLGGATSNLQHMSSNFYRHDFPFGKEHGYPKNILKFSNGMKKERYHPTQKPVELFEYLIKTYTKERDLVLDNCAGSGTTAIACLNTKRQFIVMEKEQKYYDIILKRVADFNKNFESQTLFGNEM